jgi:pimeloyl-ACP methyl ester carboxylesterase
VILRLLQLAALVGVVSCSRAPASRPGAAPGSFTEGAVQAGGVSLHVKCLGQGAPTVIFDSGLGNDGSIWNDVQQAVSRTNRACVYDRAGLGASGPAPRPHTSRQMVRELHAVLEEVNLDGPHVLVGHSLGGLNMRLYAAEYGAAGLVLVDSASEDQDARYWSLLPAPLRTAFEERLREIPEGLDFDAFRESLAQVRSSKRSLGNVPVMILTQGKADPPPPGVSPELAAEMARVWGEMQADLRRLSTASTQIVVPESGHFIQREAPDVVISAIRRVLEATRTGTRP